MYIYVYMLHYNVTKGLAVIITSIKHNKHLVVISTDIELLIRSGGQCILIDVII